jgi:hypothetical protein
LSGVADRISAMLKLLRSSKRQKQQSPCISAGASFCMVAPGVELDTNILIYKNYFCCNVISISIDTLVMQNDDAGT